MRTVMPGRTKRQQLEPHSGAARRLWPSLATFYVLAVLAAALLGAAQPGSGIDPGLISLTQFAPAIAALVVLALWRGGGRPPTALGLGGWRFATRRTLYGVLTVAAIFVSIAGAYALLGIDLHPNAPQNWEQPVAALLVAQLIGAAAEEVGWRCLLHPSLETRWGTIGASLAVGVLWGLWHVPTISQGPAVGATFVAATVAMSVMMGELLRGSGGNNLVVSAVFHAAVNIGMFSMLDEENGSATAMATLAIATVVGALIWIVLGRFGAGRREASMMLRSSE